jgi:putative MFS transporter
MFRDRRAFWVRTGAVIAGVVLHLPMFVHARDMDYRLVGMPVDPGMLAGMGLIVGGLALSAYGLVPAGSARRRDDPAAHLSVQTLDEAPLRLAHVLLLLVMAAAVTIDVMKPTTLAFVVPGMAEEYGLKSALHPDGDVPVALFPFVALVGMVIGSSTPPTPATASRYSSRRVGGGNPPLGGLPPNIQPLGDFSSLRGYSQPDG